MKEVINDLEYIKEYINSTREYYHDGVDEELKDFINDIIKKIKKLDK